ncbi:MAG TPA: hypothetical protein VIY28_08805 [Pseudonocardiaceae bacterium]
MLVFTAGIGLTWTVVTIAPAMPQPAAVQPVTPTTPTATTPAGPSAASPSPPITTAPAPTTAIISAQAPEKAAAVAATVQQAMHAALPSARVSFEVYDRQTATVLTSQNQDQQFAAMSVVKLLIALDSLARNDWAVPGGAAQQQLHQILADSDDDIADDMWNAAGGPALVTRMVKLLGLTGTEPPVDPTEWGDTLITAQDMVTIYRYITDQLPTADRVLLITALSDTPRYAADGFDQYFGIPNGLPQPTCATKQGWGTSGSDAVMNSTGLVGKDSRYVVVVLASASENSYSKVPSTVTAGASALQDLIRGSS